MTYHPGPEGEGIYLEDCLVAAASLPPESFRLVYCDPPYSRESMGSYKSLGVIGERLLSSDGLLFAYATKGWLNEAIEALNARLEYFWIICLYEPGPKALARHWQIRESWRPILVYRKKGSRKKLSWARDLVESSGRSKELHRWQQETYAPTYYISYFTEPGDVVLDPFCGSGTTAAVCKELGRRWLTFDVDPMAIEVAKRRLSLTKVPLFTVGEQAKLALDMGGQVCVK